MLQIIQCVHVFSGSDWILGVWCKGLKDKIQWRVEIKGNARSLERSNAYIGLVFMTFVAGQQTDDARSNGLLSKSTGPERTPSCTMRRHVQQRIGQLL